MSRKNVIIFSITIFEDSNGNLTKNFRKVKLKSSFWYFRPESSCLVWQNNYSGAPAAEGRHAEPHTYRTHIFIFAWSSSSAVNGSRALRTTTTSHNMVPTLVNLCIAYIYAVSYWISILWSIDSCQIKVSADQFHMIISRAQVGTQRGQVFFKVDRWLGYGFSLDCGLKCFPKLLEQAKQPVLCF